MWGRSTVNSALFSDYGTNLITSIDHIKTFTKPLLYTEQDHMKRVFEIKNMKL